MEIAALQDWRFVKTEEAWNQTRASRRFSH
eukprot:SAG31_NODE_3384_length_4334_cov_5.140496_1_plen_30_part_00